MSWASDYSTDEAPLTALLHHNNDPRMVVSWLAALARALTVLWQSYDSARIANGNAMRVHGVISMARPVQWHGACYDGGI